MDNTFSTPQLEPTANLLSAHYVDPERLQEEPRTGDAQSDESVRANASAVAIGSLIDAMNYPVNETAVSARSDAVAQLPQFSEAEMATLLGGDRKIKQKPEKGLELAERIVKAAEESRGEYLWYPDHAKITENGNLGCAIAVSRVLQKAGYRVGDHTGVRNLVKALDWTRINDLSKAQPGDLVVGHNKQGGNHIGIVGRGGEVWNNSWRAIPMNIWVSESMSLAISPGWMWGGYTERYLLRPPKK